jgi:nucleoside phosphorylase
VRGAKGDAETLERRLVETSKHAGTEAVIRVRPYATEAQMLEADYCGSSIFVMPSREEGFGLAACDAISMGVPVLITSASGLADAVREMAEQHMMRIDDCIVEHDSNVNPTAIRYAEAAMRILVDEDGADQYVHQLRERLLPTCSWEAAAKKLLEMLGEKNDLPQAIQHAAAETSVIKPAPKPTRNAEEVIEKNAEALWKPGVIAVSVKEAIVVIVEEGHDPQLPEKIDDINVVVRSVKGIQVAGRPAVRAGDAVLVDGVATARVGPLVSDPNGQIFAVTAAHAIDRTASEIAIRTQFGRVSGEIYMLDEPGDLALISVHAIEYSGEGHRVAEPTLGGRVTIFLGDRFVAGTISGVRASARIGTEPDDSPMQDMFEVSLADGHVGAGDSGALVLDERGHVVGMLTALLSQASERAPTVFAKSLGAAFTRLGLRVMSPGLPAPSSLLPSFGVIVDSPLTGQALRDLLTLPERRKYGSGAYLVGTLGAEGPTVYVHVLTSTGNLGSAVAATNLLRDVPLDFVFVVGLAGGMLPRVQHNGDVVVSSEVVYYEPAKFTQDQVIPRFRVVGLTPRWIADLVQSIEIDPEALGGTVQHRRPAIQVGAIASGEKVVHGSEQLRDFLGGWGHVLAIEMESAGVAEAAASSPKNISIVVVRGIADVVGAVSKDDVSRDLAAATAVYVAKELMLRITKKK